MVGYVTFDLLKSLPQYREDDYGTPIDIANDLLTTMMKAKQINVNAFTVKQLRFFFIALRTKAAYCNF